MREGLQQRALSLMRIVVAFTFICHGVQKFLGAFGGFGGHAAATGSLLWVAGLVESIGGLLLILGLFTRPVAFILCGEMAVAYFIQHAPRGVWPLLNGGELAVLYCFVFLYLAIAGGGSVSLDRLLRKKP
ncbi:MAG TPA: DoxX family protein [Bryobacteraceae bacterium]|nr:DoxX family protein [Bryobacteraceae bacterium]